MGVTGIQLGGMVLPYLWASLTLVLLALNLSPTKGSAIISEEDLIRALLARGAQEGYDTLDQDIRLLGKRAPFNSWAGKRSSEEEIIHEPEYVRRKRSSDETDLAEPDPPAVVPGGGLDQHGLVPGSGARFARDLRDSSAVVKDQVYRPVRATFSAWGGKRSLR